MASVTISMHEETLNRKMFVVMLGIVGNGLLIIDVLPV